MAIRENENNGKITYDVSISISSKIKPKLRVQMLKRSIPTLKEAKAIERELIRESAVELSIREGVGVLWKDLIERWEIANKKVSIVDDRVQQSTLWEISAVLNRFTTDWMDRACTTITSGDVKKVLREMENEGYSKGRLKAFRSAVNVVFKWAIDEGEIFSITHSPANGVELANIEEKPQPILSLQEVHHLLDCAKALNHEWYPVWATALNTGMRSGELYALEWSDVDFESKLITVSKSYNKRMNVNKSTKAGYWRKIPINADLEELLLTLRNGEQGKTQHVLPRINMWRRGEAAKILKEFCIGIGICEIHFHALRACFATHMLNAGASSPVVKKICGWTDEKVMTRYIRLAGIDVSGATNNLGFMAGSRHVEKVVNMHGYNPIRKRKES